MPLIVRFRAEKASRNAFLTELRDELKSAHLVALTKALAELADTDPLTGLRNRRSLSETLNGKWAEACARNDWFGVLMIDIDRFKLFNDTAGHEEGDRCLKQIASALLVETNRYGQYIARFGGEEFTAILSGLAQEPTLEVAESLRRTVEELAIPHPGGCQGQHCDHQHRRVRSCGHPPHFFDRTDNGRRRPGAVRSEGGRAKPRRRWCREPPTARSDRFRSCLDAELRAGRNG